MDGRAGNVTQKRRVSVLFEGDKLVQIESEQRPAEVKPPAASATGSKR
jgi:hypothetical protein